MFRKVMMMVGAGALALATAATARAQANPVDLDVAEYFAVCDTNRDGKIQWQEALDRDREYSKALRKAKSEAEREKTVQAYEILIDREWFLVADADDDFILTRAELKKDLENAPTAVPGQEPPPEHVYTDKDLLKLAEANVDEQWSSLLADADKNRDKKLSKEEIENHFLLGKVEVAEKRVAPNGDRIEEEAAVGDDEDDIGESFTGADKDRDGKLSKAEYVGFVAAEYRNDRREFLDYLVFVGRDDDRTTVAGGAPAVGAGTTAFYKAKPEGRGDWEYKLLTLEKVSALGFQGSTINTDVNQKPVGGKGAQGRSWSKGVGGEKVEKIKVAAGEFECVVEETTRPSFRIENGKRVQGEPVKVKTWYLKEFRGIEVKIERGGELAYELLELKIKK